MIVIVVSLLAVGMLIFAGVRLANESIFPLFLNSRIARLGEKNLPKVFVENGTVYCRMKADDFRFPLPPGSRAANFTVTGGFDTVDGSIEARFDGTNHVTADDYESFLLGKIQVGGRITERTIPEGLLIEFHYFGDR